MLEQKWRARFSATHAKSLPLIINAILGVQVLAFLRDVTIIGTELPSSLIVVNVLSVAMMIVMIVWVRTRNILDRHSHRIAALAIACVAAKAIASSVAQADPIPFYMAIVIFAFSLCFLSQRYMLMVSALFIVSWGVLTSTVLTQTELISTFVSIVLGGVFGVYVLQRRMLALVEIFQLEQRVETLESILPMCAGCKKTRDHLGAWRRIEEFIEDQEAGLHISHSVCPDCAGELYSNLYKEKQQQDADSSKSDDKK